MADAMSQSHVKELAGAAMSDFDRGITSISSFAMPQEHWERNVGLAPTKAKRENRQLGIVPEVSVLSGIADYSWIDLKRITRAIAGAGFDAEVLHIASEYHLVDKDGKLQGDVKPLTLKDGTETGIRILGFRFDERAVGGGRKAGITFEFVDSPVCRQMNPEDTNGGGWEACEMRKWFNGRFLSLLPGGVRNLVEPVRKMTNNKGEAKHRSGTTVVTPTIDRLWLLSVSEVYGRLANQDKDASYCTTYDAEGIHYKLFADQGVSTANHVFCRKMGANSWWWLRSPYADNSVGFLNVVHDGDWGWFYADYDTGVSPGFCF